MWSVMQALAQAGVALSSGLGTMKSNRASSFERGDLLIVIPKPTQNFMRVLTQRWDRIHARHPCAV